MGFFSRYFLRGATADPRCARSGKTRIGIAGCGPSVGVTHFSIMTACYAVSVLRRRTALLEWNQSGDFARLQEVYGKKNVMDSTGKTFNILDIYFFREAGREQLRECLERDFCMVIIDFGVFREDIRDDFLQCDRRFLVCSASEWQLPGFAAFLSGNKEQGCRYEYFSAFGKRENTGMAERFLKVSIRQIPLSLDAFVITGESLSFFGKFLK